MTNNPHPICAVVPVRMGSSRLPGKVMHEILNKPILGHLLDRIFLSKQLDGLVVATSLNPENDVIDAYCKSRNIECFRGAEDDVLGRILGALKHVYADTGVLIFGDTPLIDPRIIDQMITTFLNKHPDYDFVGNDLKTTFPPGMEVEVFKVSALEDSDKQTQDPKIREHSTLFIRQNPDKYQLLNIEAQSSIRRPELELEVDVEEDLFVITSLLKYFASRPDFSIEELIKFLDDRPNLSSHNQNVARRWKEFRKD